MKKPAATPAVATRRESPDRLRQRAAEILRILSREFPDARTELLHENPFQLLIATILSAQCTDERVNLVTGPLFLKYPGPEDLAAVQQEILEREIRSTGFFRMKAKNIIASSKAIVERYQSKVPDRIEDLVQLPGVGRKTANVVLGQAFGITSGVVVDTHVHRLSQRLGFSAASNPEEVEQELIRIFPERDWIALGSVLILHGRRTCKARNPQCPACKVNRLCPSAELFLSKPSS